MIGISNIVQITNNIPIGTDIFRAGPWAGGPHLDLYYGDGWTNPLLHLPRNDANIANITLTPQIKLIRNNTLTA